MDAGVEGFNLKPGWMLNRQSVSIDVLEISEIAWGLC